ncbi:MAG: hypothetical protein QG623_507 [Patescibacteria group bacterium]|nr:hypothetical protein [Patescibacteria group bacterium]
MKKSYPGSKLIPILSVVFFISLLAATIINKDLNLQFRLSPLVLIPLASIATNVFLLVTISRHRRHIKSIMWFGIFLICNLFWAMADIITFLAANRETGLFARAFVLIPALIGVASVIIFFSDTSSDKEDAPIGPRILMLINAFFYFVVALGTNIIFLRQPEALISRAWGYEINVGPYSILYLLWTQIMLLLVLWIVIKYYRISKAGAQKKQAKIFLISVLFPVLGTTAVNLVPAIIGVSIIPLDSLFVTCMAVIMAYGINKYQLFTISPTQISNNILQTMAEAVVVTDLNFSIQYANKNAVKLLNLEEPVSSFTQTIGEFLKESDFEDVKQAVQASKGSKVGAELSGLVISAKKTGQVTPVDISMSSIASEGRRSGVAGYVFVVSDISALQQAYSKLEEQEKKVEQKVIQRTEELYNEHAKLAASIAGLPVGFIMLDDDMHVLEQNSVAKRLLGNRSEGHWYVKEALDDLGIMDKFMESSKNSEIMDIAEVEHHGRLLHIIFSPIIVDSDKKLGNVILIEDITSQKAAERERNEFIVTASHEIRTPLSIIQGYLSNTLDMDKEVSPKIRPLLNSAYRASNQISSLFTDILIVSDIENSANPKPRYETRFVLQAAVQEVIDKLSEKAELKKVKLKYEPKGYRYEVFGDRDEIKESILKLIDNGIKFTDKGGVEVKLGKKAGKIQVLVIDSGKGITKAERVRLFKKFVRLDNSLKRSAGGAGLGLYIARALAERNGGSLDLESSGKDGSTFSLLLPLVD